MVTSRQRGQLLLTTAVVLALIILSLTVLLNAAATTDIRSPDDPATDLVETDRLSQDIEYGSAGLIGQLQGSNRFSSNASLQTAINKSIKAYADILYESAGDRRATHVTLAGAQITQHGTYVADPDRESNLTDGDNSTRLIKLDPAGDTAPLAGMRLSLAVDSLENTTETAFQIRIHGDGAALALAFLSTESGSMTITYDTYDPTDEPDFGDADSHICEAETYGDIDLTRYNRTDAACHVDPFEHIDPIDTDEYGLVFVNPANATGGYHYVVGTTLSAADTRYETYNDTTTDEPYIAPIAWSVEISLTQLAVASERQSLTDLEIYDYRHTAGFLEVPWA